MKIIYIPQPSVRSYKTGLWHLESCSMMHRMRAVVYHMPSTWEWRWLVPEGDQLSDSWADVVPDGIEISSVPWMGNVHANRWSFPLERYIQIISEFKPDLVYVECAEHVASIKYALLDQALHDTKIIAQIGYVPMHAEGKFDVLPNPILRQMEGADIADLVTFNSEVEANTWRSHAWREYDYKLKREPAIFNALFDPDDVKCYREDGRKLRKNEFSGKDGVPRIFYTGRLSDSKRTHYDKLIAALLQLKEEHTFKVWVGNPNEAIDQEKAHALFPNTEIIHTGSTLTRRQYVEHLWAADIVPILIPNRTASFCEAVEAENFVACADMIGGGEDRGIWRIDEPTVDEITAVLSGMLETQQEFCSEEKKKHYRRQERWICTEHAVHKKTEEIQEMFESC